MADIKERPMKLDLDALVLGRGAHDSPEIGMCVMEAVAYVAGEPHSDHPSCASPVIGAFLRRWNDDLDDAGRQRLKPYISILVGTAASPRIEMARGWLAADWLVRTHTAAWLDLAGLRDQAEALRALPEVLDAESLEASGQALRVARLKAAAVWAAAGHVGWAAASAAAGDVVWAASSAAASAAAGDVVWAASSAAALDAARGAAWSAASAAAWSAASAAAASAAAAKKQLEPTRLSLQESAFALIDRMIALGGAA